MSDKMSMKMSDKYEPPFTLNEAIVNLAAEISAKVERFVIRMEQPDGLRLRRINQIQSIHSSLAIEGNMLSEDQVSDIIEGKRVIAPAREILPDRAEHLRGQPVEIAEIVRNIEDIEEALSVIILGHDGGAGHGRYNGYR